MFIQKYIRQVRKFSRRESQAESAAQSATYINETIEMSNLTRVQSACVIDFVEAHDWLLAGFEQSSRAFDINRMAEKVSASRLPSIGRIDRFEDLLYWFLSAATLSYLLFGIVF
jgi:hypothetical protein